MKKFLLSFLVLLVLACKNEKGSQTSDATIVERIAQANGIENWNEVEELRYTFNVRVNDSLRTSRAWTWNPKTGMVTLTTPDSIVTYNHKSEAGQHETTDQRFINDQYWLLFPFHLVWDDMEYDYVEQATAPISGDNMQLVTVKYPADAGYTPGDVYDVYVDENHIIREWVYKSGGSEERPFATTWEDYQEFNGINIATMHRNDDGSFELFFTDISIE